MGGQWFHLTPSADPPCKKTAARSLVHLAHKPQLWQQAKGLLKPTRNGLKVVQKSTAGFQKMSERFPSPRHCVGHQYLHGQPRAAATVKVEMVGGARCWPLVSGMEEEGQDQGSRSRGIPADHSSMYDVEYNLCRSSERAQERSGPDGQTTRLHLSSHRNKAEDVAAWGLCAAADST